MRFARLQWSFDGRFAALALALLLLEIGIARFVHDALVRPFVGDLLVVILIFAACRTCIVADHRKLAVAVLLFAFAIETAQYFQVVRGLGLEDNALARIVIGMTFDVRDLLAYSLGIALVLATGAWIRQARRARAASSSRSAVQNRDGSLG